MLASLFAQLTLVFGPVLYNQTDTTIEIVYETSTASKSTLYYFDGLRIETRPSFATDIHKISLVGLQPNTVHYYAIESNGQWSDLYAFKTLETNLKSIKFGVWGDNQVGDETFRRIIYNFLLEGCQYWLGAGDYIQNAETRQEWVTKFDQPMLGLNHYISIIGARGNHDAETPYAHRYFQVPNGVQWGAITVGPIRFVILDTNEDVPIRVSLMEGGAQRNWLLQEIASPQFQLAKFKIIIYHHPHMTNIWDNGCYYGQQGNGIDILLFDIVNNILVPAKSDLIINGHSHSFQLGRIEATYHVITGGGGGFLDTGNCWRHPHIFDQESSYHYLTIDLLNDILSVEAKRLDGSVINQFRIIK